MPNKEIEEAVDLDGQRFRGLELTVLQQVREGLSLVNSNMRSFGAKLDSVHERVMAIELAKFDQKIGEAFEDGKEDLRRTEKELQRQIDELRLAKQEQDIRVRAAEVLLSRFGAFLLVLGTVGGAVLAAVVTKVFGGH